MLPCLFVLAGAHFPLLAGLEEELSSLHPRVPSSKIRGYLVTSLLGIAREEFDLKRVDLTCVRDYSGCPENWADLGGGSCGVPLAYDGSCSVVSFKDKTPLEKSEVASECAARFPCMGRITEYHHLCPEGWIENDGGQCSAPRIYSGPCVRHYDFGELDEPAKRKFEEICEVFWPAGKPSIASPTASSIASSIATSTSSTGSSTASSTSSTASKASSPASFLQFPNIGKRLRNGIFAVGPMRSPPRALINVIESENTQGFLERGANLAREDKVVELKKSFRKRIAALET